MPKMKKRNRLTEFDDSLFRNMHTYNDYLDMLTEIAISTIGYDNLPATVSERYLELSLFWQGRAIYFRDDVIGDLALSCNPHSELDVYGEPYLRTAYSRYNSYTQILKSSNSVIIWNNRQRLASEPKIRSYAYKLYNIDRTIDINVRAQKTPILLKASENKRLSVVNAYKEFDGNAPVICADDKFNSDSFTVLKTDAPYVSDKLYQLKVNIWNEALTYLGISNVTIQKRERVNRDEVMRGMGGVFANRFSRLEARKDSVKRINEMFGTEIEVYFREDFENVMSNADIINVTAPSDDGIGGESDE